MSGEEESDLAGMSLVKRSRDREPPEIVNLLGCL